MEQDISRKYYTENYLTCFLFYHIFHSVGKYKNTFLTAENPFPTQPQLFIKILEVAGTVPPSSKHFKGKAGQQRRYPDQRGDFLDP